MKGLEYALSNLQGTCTSKTRAKYRRRKKGKQIGLFLTFAAFRIEEEQGFYVPHIGFSPIKLHFHTKSRIPRLYVTDLVMKCVISVKDSGYKRHAFQKGGGFHRDL